MDAKDILTNLNTSEINLPVGSKIYKANCEYCGKSHGYILVTPDKAAKASNVVVTDDYEKPKELDIIKCLACGETYSHAMDLYNELIYTKRGHY